MYLLPFREPAEGLEHSLELSLHISETNSPFTVAAICRLCFVKGHLVCCS